jgi:hypothetical protein
MNKERINIEQEKGYEISIKSYFDEGKQNLLIVWIVLWSFAGIGIISQFFVSQLEEFTAYLIVWVVFWVYFEYKVIYAFRWRKYGMERITIKDEALYISREISNRGIPQKYEVNWIKDLKVKEVKESNFVAAISSAYWNPGGERIVFNYKGKDILFGMELNEDEAKRISKALGKKLNEIRS